MRIPLELPGLFCLITLFAVSVIPVVQGGCSNTKSDDYCQKYLHHCVPSPGKKLSDFATKECPKACFYCDANKCRDYRNDCPYIKDLCEKREYTVRSQCMKTCGDCPKDRKGA